MSRNTWSQSLSALAEPRVAVIGASVLAAASIISLLGNGTTAPSNVQVATANATGSSNSAVSATRVAQATAVPSATPSASDATPVTLVKSETAKPNADAGTPLDQAAVEKIVRAYLLKNPEILVQMSQELERRQREAQQAQHASTIVERKDGIYNAEADYVFGNAKGDVSVVEFFDYNCAWCKRALDQVQKLVDGDDKVRVVMKEMPIFGEDSMFAAKAALAAKRQNKYWELHVALMQEQRVDKDVTLRVAKGLGIDTDKLQKDMSDPVFDKAIANNLQLAEALGIQGTPGFIIDTKVNVGFMPLDGLKQSIAEVRKDGCKAC